MQKSAPIGKDELIQSIPVEIKKKKILKMIQNTFPTRLRSV